MNREVNYSTLKKFCLAQGVDLFGVADIREIKKEFFLPEAVLKRYDSAVAIGVRISRGILEEITNFPTKLYFHHYRALNNFLDQAGLRVSSHIQNKGYFALPIPASQILDWQNQKGHLSHKKIGYLAGLGWIGRNNLLVNKKFGSQLRLSTVLTDMPLKANKPVKDSCEECRACLVACPVEAIKEAAADFDHLRCFEKLKEFQRQKLTDQYICGVCVNACRGRGKR